MTSRDNSAKSVTPLDTIAAGDTPAKRSKRMDDLPRIHPVVAVDDPIHMAMDLCQPVCSCGWSGHMFSDWSWAARAAKEHLVAHLTEGPDNAR